MGTFTIFKTRPLAPIELIVGFSAVARGLYLLLSFLFNHDTILSLRSTAEVLAISVIFMFSGVALMVGTLIPQLFLRLSGALLVSVGSVLVCTRLFSDESVTVSVWMSNITIATVALILLIINAVEKYR